MPKLTPKQKARDRHAEAEARGITDSEDAFITHYLGAGSYRATDAMRLVGFKGSELSLRRAASQMKKRPRVQAAIKEVLEAHALTREEVLHELAEVARIPLYWTRKTGEVNKDGEQIEEVIETSPAQIKNKVSALTTLAKNYGLLIDKVEQSGEVLLKVQYGEDGSANADN